MAFRCMEGDRLAGGERGFSFDRGEAVVGA